MNSLVETVISYFASTIEVIQGMMLTSIHYVLDILRVLPDAIFELTNSISKPTDQLSWSFAELYKQSNDLFSFDHFQLLLVKIFLLALLSILIMILAAWHIYGAPIAEQFMYSEMTVETEHNDAKNR